MNLCRLISLVCVVTFCAVGVRAQNDLAGHLTVQYSAKLTGILSPSTITSDQNDYNPTGLSSALVLRLQSDGSRSITGLQGGAAGRILVIVNVGTETITLVDQSASSSAANRFALGSNQQLATGAGASLIYDSTSSRWRVFARTASSSTGAGSGDVTGPSSAADNAIVRFDLTSGKAIQNSSVTLADNGDIGVPDGFTLSSAGSVAVAAGGTDEMISFAPSGAGNVEVLLNSQSVTPAFRGLHITGVPAANTGFTVDSFGAIGIVNGRRANGTVGSPTALAAEDQIFTIGARGYGATGYSTGSKAAFVFTAAENWTDDIQSTYARIDITPRGTNTAYSAMFFGNGGILALNPNGQSVSFQNWGTAGVVLRSSAATYTNATSSGTVAASTAHSLAVPTFAASSATTFTNAANLYIGGDVAAGTNVTLTNSYGLWNAGKTLLNGNLLLDRTSALAAGTTQVANFSVNSAADAGGTTDVRAVSGFGIIASGPATATYGGDFQARNNSTGAVTLVNGIKANARVTSSGNTTNGVGLQSQALLTSSGNMTNWRGVHVVTPSLTSTGTITDARGINIEAQKTTGVTTGYGVYQAGATDLNYFEGTVQLPSTNTGGLQLYNTADQTTNYERLEALWSGNTSVLRTTFAGSGTQRNLRIGVGGSGSSVTRSIEFSLNAPFITGGYGSTSGSGNAFVFQGTNTSTSGSIGQVAITPTYNQASGTAANTDLLINRTETAVGGGTQRLLDLQVGGTSRFSVSNAGNTLLTRPSATTYANGTDYMLDITTSGPAGGASTQVRALQAVAEVTGSQAFTGVVGASVDGRNASSATGDVTGLSANARLTSTGSTTNLYGVRSIGIVSGSGSTTNLFNFEARSPSRTSTGNITNAYGFYSAAQAQTGVTNAYGFYQDGASDLNYFSGATGIGNAPSATSALTLPASTTGVSSLRIPHGAAPTSPVNGDIWSTTSGLYVRVNGSTVGPLGTGGGGGTPGGSDTQVQFNDGGSFGGDSGFTFNKTTDAVTIGGTLTAGSGTTQVTDAAGKVLSAALNTVAIAQGGTGQTSQTAAFDNLAPTTTQGDLIYYNGTDNVRLAKGTAGQVLTMNAGATAPEWAAASSSSGAGQLVIPWNTGEAALQFTNMPSSPTFLGYISRFNSKVDLTNYTQIRFTGKQIAAAASGAKLILGYKTTSDSNTVGDFSDIGTSSVSVTLSTSTDTTFDSGWINLAAGAKADVWITLYGDDGDGAADPTFGKILVHFK